MPVPQRRRCRGLVATLAALGLTVGAMAGEASTQDGIAGPLPSDEVTRANALAAAGHGEEAIALLELHVSTNPNDALAKQTLLSLRIAAMEIEIRRILGEQAKSRELVIGDPDYESARARADSAVGKRLDIAEYYAHNRHYPEAAMVCNAILKDYPHHPAALKLKFRILTEMVERERAELLRDKALRRDDAINDVVDDATMPGELPKGKRTIFVFDEDVAELERASLTKKLQQRCSLIYDGTQGTKSAQVREVLQLLFAYAGINYVILDSALGSETLTIHLENETIESALSTVSKLVNIRYNYTGGTVFISSATSDVMVTEIIRVHSGLTDVVTEPQLGEDVAGQGGQQGGQNGQNGQMQGGGIFNQGGAGAKGGGEKGGAAGQPFVSDLERFIDKIPDIVVNWPAEGKIYLDRKSNTVYVRSTPSTIMEVKRLLQALDYNNTQVLIEARFIEVTDSGAKELGIDWGAGGKSGDTYLSAPTTGLTLPTATDPGASISNIPGGPGAVGGGLLAQLLVAPSDYLKFKATIVALETSGKADTLSEPKILTLNNAVGIIEVKQDISYISGYTNAGTTNTPTSPENPNNGTVINPGYNYSSANLVPQFTKDSSGIQLRIRPSVARNSDVITLSIMPSVRELVRLPQAITFNNSNGSSGGAPITNQIERPPEFDTRRLVTALHVKNGGTVALGGLSKEKQQESRSGLPFLSRVPVIGSLFRHDSKSSERRNLMIFVTAHIIDPHGAKEGDEIQRLRDTARVLLPADVETAEKNSAAEAAKPDPTPKQEDNGPIWRRDRRR